MSKGKPLFALLTTLILLSCCSTHSDAQNKPPSSCVSSSCGQISISYPFRLATDPANCGHPDPIFKVSCQENQTIFSSNSRTYNVQSISYNNFSIRVTDPGLVTQNYSSCPIYPSLEDNLSSMYIFPNYSNTIYITFVNCLRPVNNPSYIENLACGNRRAFSNSSQIHSYSVVGNFPVPELEESCSSDMTALVSLSFVGSSNNNNYSYTMIHDLMAYGLELTWYRAMCGECEQSNGRCSVENNKIRCNHYCYEDTPFEEKTFLCKLEFYGALIFVVGVTIGGIIGLRFIIGIILIIGLVVHRRRKQRREIKKRDVEQEEDVRV